MFLTCLVPLQLKNRSKEDEVLWTNERPSSSLFCCPVRFQYVKETSDTVKSESEYILEKLDELAPIIIHDVSVTHLLEMTMVDGKVATILSDKSNATTSCSICGLTTSQMNNLVEVDKKAAAVAQNLFEHGISTLHLWIR